MAKYTTNYNLTKPDENENYDVEIFNDNADTVDTELKKVNDALANKADASSVVTSVAGKTGAVTLTKSDVSLNNVDNTADTAKPISTAMQTALDKKVNNTSVLTDVPANAVFTDTKYTAGNNVAISEENVISATNTTYTEISTNEIDEGISSTLRLITGRRMKHALDKKADASKVLTDVPANAEFTDTKYTAGSNVAISEANVVSATDTKYSEITTTEIDDGTSSTLRAITGRRMKHALDKKVNTDQVLTPVPADAKFTDTKYSAGTNVSISGTTISATDTKTTINGKTGAIAKADITALGIPAQDTVYTHPPGTNPHGTTKSDVGLSNVDNVKQMPISGGILENYREKITTVSASAGSINLSLGNVFQHTPSGDRTYSITNAVNSQAHSFTLIINMGATVRTLTFPSSVKWQGGEIPDLTTASKTYVLTFMTTDAGTTWLGMFGGEF